MIPTTRVSKIAVIALIACSTWAPYAVHAEDATQAIAAAAPTLKAGVVTSPPPSRTLSLSDCFEKADLHNKEILSAKWNLAIAKAGIRLASAIPNPIFQLQEGFGPSFYSVATGQNVMFQWTEQILTMGKRTKKVDLARANLGLAELQFNALRFDVHNRVRRAYAELAAAEAYAELIESERAVGVKLLAIAKRRFSAGKAPQTECLQAQLNVSQFDTQRNQAQIRLQQDTAAVTLIIGETPGHIDLIDVDDNGLFKLSSEKTDIVPSPMYTPSSLETLFTTAYKSRPDWKACEQNCAVERKALVLARAQRWPDLYVGGGYQWMQLARHQVPELTPVPDSIGNGSYFTLSFENPILYQHQGEVRQAIGNVRQAERQCDLLKCQVATDVATAYNEVIVARANIFLFQKNLLPTAAQVASVARKGYEFGATDLAAAIVAQQQYQQILSTYFDAVVAYQVAWADLEKAVGAPLSGR
jgi:outer membrane protein, heavy metal efflux system